MSDSAELVAKTEFAIGKVFKGKRVHSWKCISTLPVSSFWANKKGDVCRVNFEDGTHIYIWAEHEVESIRQQKG